MSPADIAAPIRHILRRQRNCHVVLAEITSVDLERKLVHFVQGDGDATAQFDWLILAAGATHSYFGKPEWERLAPGLKTLEDATEIRKRILLAFENAEYETSPQRRRAALTFAIVGGGPTGVELAGAISEIAAKTIPSDFRNIDTKTTRVVLFEGGDRLLPAFPPQLSERARRDLVSMGVEVRLNARVTDINVDGLYLGAEFLPVRNVLWAAGVMASPLGASLGPGVPTDRAGRVLVGPDLSVPGHPRVFVTGDLAHAVCPGQSEPVAGVAQGGMQMGAYAGRVIASEVGTSAHPATRKPFVYKDKGIMATIGRSRAVGVVGGFKISGFPAWLFWGGLHVMFLVNYRSRIIVALSWMWNWLLFSRDARLITGPARLDISGGMGVAPAPSVADPHVHDAI
ncbi:MAG: NAD(P)/FAD-dependent oxidoreductase [Planctomycetota bacterium]